MPSEFSRENNPLKTLLLNHPKFHSGYAISFSEPNRHMAYVCQRVKNTAQAKTLAFQLPAWRPGRYTIQNYAAQVSGFEAFSDQESLSFQKTDKQTWVVDSSNAEWVNIVYRFFAPGPLDAGNCYVGYDEIFLTMSNMLMHEENVRFHPTLLHLEQPHDWQIATDLEQLDSENGFAAASYDDLIDSPIIMSPSVAHFDFEASNTRFHIYIQSKNTFQETSLSEAQIKTDLARIVDTQFKLMDDNPLERDYAFLYHFLPNRFYHGVEHKHACSIVLGPAKTLKEKYNDFLSISSHEFFHIWCVKRMLPDVFAPYNYSQEAYTTLLYIFEGFTSYYGDLSLWRSGLWSEKTYMEYLSKDITYVQNNYGRTVQTLADSSYNAWLTGYRRGADLNSINFYVKGLLVGLCLDFELRHRTQNRVSLDHVMRELNERYAKRNLGFNETQFESLVDELAGSSFKAFFDHYVRSTKEIPYNDILSYAGLKLEKTANTNLPSIGAVMSAEEGPFPTLKFAIPDSAAFRAGLDQNDQLVAINDASLMNAKLNDVLSRHNAGETIQVSYIRQNALKKTELILEENYAYRVVKCPDQTDEQSLFFSEWLNPGNS